MDPITYTALAQSINNFGLPVGLLIMSLVVNWYLIKYIIDKTTSKEEYKKLETSLTKISTSLGDLVNSNVSLTQLLRDDMKEAQRTEEGIFKALTELLTLFNERLPNRR